MRILIWIGLLIAVVATLSGQSGKSAQAPARSATLSSDIQPDSLNRLPVVKREQMDENGKDVAAAGEKETVVVRLGRQILREHKLDSATFAKAVDLFGKQGTVELVILMGDYTLNAMLLDALDQHLPADRKPLLPLR